MSESSVAGGKAGQLARLDKDMKLVAEKHWLNHANASVKSLKALSPVKYLLDCTKPLSLSLNGVRVSAYVVCDACVCVCIFLDWCVRVAYRQVSVLNSHSSLQPPSR